MIVKTKKWGNSMGVILPRNTINQLDLKLGDELIINVEKKSSILREMFGSLKFSKTPEKLLKEIRKEDLDNMRF